MLRRGQDEMKYTSFEFQKQPRSQGIHYNNYDSGSTGIQQQQRYNSTRASSSGLRDNHGALYLCAVFTGRCNRNNVFMSTFSIKHTSSNLILSSNKLDRLMIMFPLVSLDPHPEGKPFTRYTRYIMQFERAGW